MLVHAVLPIARWGLTEGPQDGPVASEGNKSRARRQRPGQHSKVDDQKPNKRSRLPIQTLFPEGEVMLYSEEVAAKKKAEQHEEKLFKAEYLR
ncbi:hypothetical protein WJX84_010998 [Apatococcus fuscideae]|uniref:Uncharacterized protein n=1 Tax=Apatococcus fuscideae TaxID=2026836 RepID=A0AAW1SNT8_9CHLO